MKKEERPKPPEPGNAWGSGDNSVFGMPDWLYWTIAFVISFGAPAIIFLLVG